MEGGGGPEGDNGQYRRRGQELQATGVVAAGRIVEAEIAEDRAEEQEQGAGSQTDLIEATFGDLAGPGVTDLIAEGLIEFELRVQLLHRADGIIKSDRLPVGLFDEAVANGLDVVVDELGGQRAVQSIGDVLVRGELECFVKTALC